MENTYSNKPSLLSYRGRARRRTYWFTILGISLVAAVATFITILPFINDLAQGGIDDLEVAVSRHAIELLILLAIGTVTFILLLPVSVRRLHDRNMSGWWILAFMLGGMIPYVGSLVSIVQFVIMGCLAGTPGPNRFGPDPKGRG